MRRRGRDVPTSWHVQEPGDDARGILEELIISLSLGPVTSLDLA